MSIRIKCVIIVVLILGLLKILGLIKKNKLELKYALSWLFLEVGILIITLIPNLLNVISKALGIYNEINMLFTSKLYGSFVIFKNLKISVECSGIY